MSISLYYRAERDRPLTLDERALVEDLIKRNAISLEKILADRTVGFSIACLDASGVVLEGSVNLPKKMDVVMEHLERWLEILGGIRRQVPDLVWSVHVDDHEIPWDPVAERYDADA